MDTFFHYFKKFQVAVIALFFAFAATYIPQIWPEETPVAYAGGGVATEVTQLGNNALLGSNVGNTAASAVSNAATAVSTGSLWLKENVLDGIGWAIAKRIVSQMVRSLIDWINSGFQGSPAFITDLQGFLLNAADEAIGSYIDELGGIGSFVCSPFRLDVQVSVALQYQQARSSQPAPTCTLTGIIDNIEGFIQGSFSEGGWNDWFDITAQPEVYTPYGSMLEAQAEAQARIVNAQGEEITLLDWGDGFLSGKVCEAIEGTSAENCTITKPGKVIQEALTFQLESGPRSLIEADEINEVIAALLGQVAQKAVTGINGLLGLSSGTGYTYSGFDGGSFLSQMEQESNNIITTTDSNRIIEGSVETQEDFRTEAATILPRLEEAAISPALTPGQQTEAQEAIAEAEEVIARTTTDYIPTLEALNDEINNPDTTMERQVDIISEYNSLRIYTRGDMVEAVTRWENITDRLETEPLPEPTPEEISDIIDEVVATYGSVSAADPAVEDTDQRDLLANTMANQVATSNTRTTRNPRTG